MENDGKRPLRARARLAGLLFLADNALYVVSVLASVAGPEEIRRPAVAFQAIAVAGTIALAWSFYELFWQIDRGLALMACLFRVAEAALFGLATMLSLVLLSAETAGLNDGALALAASARSASGTIGSVYFCAGSAIFFYLFIKSRFIPYVIGVCGLVVTMLTFASTLAEIGAPVFAASLAFSYPLLLLVEAVTGAWLLIVGVRLQPSQTTDLEHLNGSNA